MIRLQEEMLPNFHDVRNRSGFRFNIVQYGLDWNYNTLQQKVVCRSAKIVEGPVNGTHTIGSSVRRKIPVEDPEKGYI
jgi:hypothetical protein